MIQRHCPIAVDRQQRGFIFSHDNDRSQHPFRQIIHILSCGLVIANIGSHLLFVTGRDWDRDRDRDTFKITMIRRDSKILDESDEKVDSQLEAEMREG